MLIFFDLETVSRDDGQYLEIITFYSNELSPHFMEHLSRSRSHKKFD